MTDGKSNVVHLRAAIGRAGDNVAPATSPLNTDEEAAGMSPSREETDPACTSAVARPDADRDPQRSVVNAIVVAVFIAIAGIVLVALLAAGQS